MMTLQELKEILARQEDEERSYDRNNCLDDQAALSEQLIEEVYCFRITEKDMQMVEKTKQENKEQKEKANTGEDILDFFDDMFQSTDQ